MPQITINGRPLAFEPGQTILQVALDHEIEIPHYCYHPGISIAANCRICLAEVWQPNPRNDGKLEAVPKLLPTCQQTCSEGMVVYTDSPKAIQNQRAVMEYLLINHPVDCPVCDQAGECYLQDYSYQYGRGQARFQEQKIKQPKKDVGPHVLLYSDRCIMCTRCVRFCREVTGTGELIIDGRGATEQIDVFPGMALDNELSANVIDICPVGALLDKDFLFQQRVWFLRRAASIDGITASGDNISIEHNEGVVYRIKPRPNLAVNRYWITDEVRYGWKFIHREDRLALPTVRGGERYEAHQALDAYKAAFGRAVELLQGSQRIGLLVSPMLSCEDAYLLAKMVMAFDAKPIFGLGPVPFSGADKTFKDGFTLYAEKAPNARGVKRVLEQYTSKVLAADEFEKAASDGRFDTALITGNYPSDWATSDFAITFANMPVILIDTLPGRLAEQAEVVLPGATWAEKSGTFENVNNRLQAFERAIEPLDFCKGEGQIALDLLATHTSTPPSMYNAAATRQRMAEEDGLAAFTREVHMPEWVEVVESDMQVVEL